MTGSEGKAHERRQEITALATRLEELAREVDELRQQRDQDRKDVAAAKTAVAQWNARLTVEGIGPTLVMRKDIKNLNEESTPWLRRWAPPWTRES